MDASRGAAEISSLLTYAVLVSPVSHFKIWNSFVGENILSSSISKCVWTGTSQIWTNTCWWWKCGGVLTSSLPAWLFRGFLKGSLARDKCRGRKAELCCAEKGGMMLLLSAQPDPPLHPFPFCCPSHPPVLFPTPSFTTMLYFTAFWLLCFWYFLLMLFFSFSFFFPQ